MSVFENQAVEQAKGYADNSRYETQENKLTDNFKGHGCRESLGLQHEYHIEEHDRNDVIGDALSENAFIKLRLGFEIDNTNGCHDV